jgi:hypothetical protein
VEVTQPTAQQDQIELNDPATLKEKSLKELKTLDPFLHTVRIEWREGDWGEEGKQGNKQTIVSIGANYFFFVK